MAETNDLDNFLTRVMLHGLAYTVQRYYSVYRAIVDRVDDPQKRGRVQVRVPFASMTVALPEWIDPIFYAASSSRGVFWPPSPQDTVWVVFQEGDTSKPLAYLGSWFSETELPSEFSSTTVGDTAFPDK